MNPEHGTGTFYVIATPIGNLKDITVRAIECLKQVSLVVAEDTRRTIKLLNHYKIHCKVISCNEHNELARAGQIMDFINSGRDVAMVSDAGSPGLSDPGARLIAMLRQEGLRIIPIPGPSAISCILSVCGMQANSFYFAGFLPKRKKERVKALLRIKPLSSLLVFFESPRRIRACLEDMLEVFGDRKLFIAREMTKMHESYISSSIEEFLRGCPEDIKGEITLVVDGRQQGINPEKNPNEQLEATARLLLIHSDLGTKEVAKRLSEIFGTGKSEVYNMCLKFHREMNGQDIAN